ncbi:disease resistance protein [Salix suchowensis]|nr:disease resistance protein [Salix suchowensis]
MCYDELDRTEKKIFLDIACFFGRCTRDYLQQTQDLEERSGIDRLIDMCLIKLVENEIWMHDVLLKLGRDIVTQENDDPRKRSRLWDAKDVRRVLTTKVTFSSDLVDCCLTFLTRIKIKAIEGIFMQGEKDYEAASQQFNFFNCPQLDQSSLTKIIGDARLRIQRMATSLFNQQYFGEPISVRLCIPGSEVPEWFTYKNTGGPTVKIKLPDHCHRANTTDQLFGFTLCVVVSFGNRLGFPLHFDIKCECHLITKDGTQSDLTFHYYDVEAFGKLKREHVFIWSIHSHCSFKEASFHFKPSGGCTADAVVRSGVHPLFVEDCIDEPEQQQPKRLKLMGN